VTVAIPTLRAGPALSECLASLERQAWRDFEVVVIDNSGKGLAREAVAAWRGVSLIENPANAGFGAAVNQAFRRSGAPYLATLNDDAVASPAWIGALVAALESDAKAGMCASQVRLAGSEDLDSAGMLVAKDASSRQRGHRQPAARFARAEEVLLPSGSAALYRRRMLDEIGMFDEAFFLYCEDTDLGLRARWAGWRCLYVPEAVVAHRYSRTAGAASALKAYYVERNRLFVLLKDFPLRMLLRAPGTTLARYFWHLAGAFHGRGSAARFRREHSGLLELVYIVLRAHAVLLKHAPRLLRQRRAIRRTARLGAREFERLLRANLIRSREVAAL
jgi:GT2 family glycosyltransferase